MTHVADWLKRPAVLLLLALAGFALLMTVLGRVSRTGEPLAKPLSQEAGTELFGSFSPDGRQVAYSGAKDEKAGLHVFLRAAEGGAPPRQLTEGEASDVAPVWSPDAQWLAFARVEGEQVHYLVMPAAGGEARTVAEGVAGEGSTTPAVSWTPDGRQLAIALKREGRPSTIVLVPVAGGEAKAITTPPAGGEGDGMPAVSPDGSRVAFVRRGSGGEGADLWIAPLSGGEPRRLTFDEHPIRGVAWAGGGSELVFASNRGDGWKLGRIPAAGGTRREIPAAGKNAKYPALTRAGDRLVYSDSPSVAPIWRAEAGVEGSEQPLIRSGGRDAGPSYSPDGKRIAYVSDRSGFEEIWVAEADGGNAVQVTALKVVRMGQPRWSPDGANLVFDGLKVGPPEIYQTAAVAGAKPLRLGSFNGQRNPTWSRDGKWIYIGRRQVLKIPAGGGKAEVVTQRGGIDPMESADGKWLYFHRGREIWRVPVEGREEERVYEAEHNLVPNTLKPVRGGLYYMQWDYRERKTEVVFYDLEKQTVKTLLRLDRADFDRALSFDVSPDGKYIIYPKTDRGETNLMQLVNFR